ncbi:MAG: LPS export ABC transporter permease LptF [Rhodobacterales bacterium]|nr:LPS export ABC transporter permease LptF [Rhodobacterales bacterium]
MSGFNRYVFKQLLFGLLLVTAALTAIVWLLQSVRVIELIVNQGLSPWDFVVLSALMVPSFLPHVLPLALFVSVAFVYSRLVTDRELVVMRATGVSQLGLTRPAIALALGVVLVGYLLNVLVVPGSYRMFRELQWNFRYGLAQFVLREGAFNTLNNGYTVYVRERADDGSLHGLLLHKAPSGQVPETWVAERGALVETGEGVRILLFNGSRQQVDPKTRQLSILYFDTFSLDIERTDAKGVIRFREARERTLGELLDVESQPYVQPKDYAKFITEAHWRLSSPWFALGFVLIGLVFIVSGDFSRRAQTMRVVGAVTTTFAVQIGAFGVQNLCSKNATLVPLLYLGAAVPIVVTLALLIRPPRRRVPTRPAVTA